MKGGFNSEVQSQHSCGFLLTISKKDNTMPPLEHTESTELKNERTGGFKFTLTSVIW